MQNVLVKRLFQCLLGVVQALTNLKTGIRVWTTTGTFLSGDIFLPGKVLAGANSKSNKMDSPGDTQPHLTVQLETRSLPSTPQLWSGEAGVPLPPMGRHSQ